jgi:probable F420-dependent oxidoreductase
MKVRIAVGLGTATPVVDQGRLGDVVDALEDLRFDSLWLSERVNAVAPDPLAALAWAAGRTSRLKLGMSVLVVPGRNPVLLAKELATIDRLSGGRLLPAVGLGARDPREHQAFGIRREDRAAWFDEALPLMRRLWTGEPVDHHGPLFHLDGVQVGPTPLQDPFDVWLGGLAPSELRRVGRLGDGWLPSFCTPDDAADRRPVVEEAAADAGRSMDPEHWGALLVYAPGGLPERLAAAVAARRPDVDPSALVPDSLDALRSLCERFVASGFSKLVVVPAVEPDDWSAELTTLAEAVLPLQT